MNRALVSLSLLLASCAGNRPTPMPVPDARTAAVSSPGRLAYPATRKVPVVDTLHGVAVADPFRWLEDEKADEVRAWVRSHDALARAELARIPVRSRLASRLKELYYVDVLGPPTRRGDRYFWTQRHADKEKTIHYWKEGKDGATRILLDPNTWSADGSVSLGVVSVSWDGKTVAYAVRQNNSDEATLHVMEVATGRVSEVDVIPGAKYAHPSWTPAGDGFYYTRLPVGGQVPVAERPGHAEVRFHRLGTDPATDALVHPRTGDPRTFIGPSLSKDGRFLFVTVRHGWAASDVYVRDLARKQTDWTRLAVGQPAIYEAWAHRGRIYVHTNEGAPRWRVFRVDPERPARAEWTELVPERADATLESAAVVGGMLRLDYLKNAQSHVELRRLDGSLARVVELPGIGTAAGPFGDEDDDEAYLTFSSFTVPTHVYETSVSGGGLKLWSKVQVPVDPSPYVVEQVWYPSKDGTRVSMFLVHRRDLKRDGSTPCYLTGYGGFQVAQTPQFIAGIFPWLEAGGIYAIPNLRGGSEYGEAWHAGGMLERKQNTFDDFIGAAEFLVREGYTRPEKLAIAGGSNGGLLVGAAMTQRPELFKAVVCSVPLLDMVRYHLFGSGRTWIGEYGSSEDSKLFPAILAYSPYHRVRAGTRYPALLMDAADSDDRVDPMHARKFVAAVLEATTGGPVLLRIEEKAGHGGADLVKKTVERGADRWAFVMQQLGVGP